MFNYRSSFTGPSQDYYDAMEKLRRVREYRESRMISSNQSSQSSDVKGSNSFQDILGKAISAGTTGTANSSNLRVLSNVSSEYIDEKLKGTPMEGLGKAFKAAEQKYGVNALFLTSVAIHESGFGNSRIAKDKNNLFGFQAYDRSPYSSAGTFKTKEEGIMTVAKYLSENYLSENGKYFSGYSVDSIGKKYASDPNWANAVKNRMDKLSNK